MRKVFLSVPMSGKTEAEIRKEIDYLKSFADSKTDLCVDNFIDAPWYGSQLYCLGEAIKKLGYCDVIFMHPDWKSAKGCRVEEFVAREYGIEVVYIK